MLPTVQRAFHISESNLQWIITAYTITFGGFLLLGGRAADLFGRKKVFIIGVIVFTIASLIDGFSQSSTMLIVVRSIQGLAGAFMSPSALSIILVTYKEGHDRNVALSVWGAVAAGGAAAGVLLGGVITQYLGWRWNFFVNVPVGIFVVVSALRVLPRHESEETHSDLDLPGAISITASLMLLVYALVEAPSKGWTSHSSLLYFGLSTVLMIFFIINESRVKNPLMPLSIFKIRNVSGANIIQLMIASSLFSLFFFVTLYVQDILGYSPVKTGLSFLVIPAIIAITATNAPRIIKIVGYRKVLIVTPILIAIGLYMLGHIKVGGSYATNILPGLIVMALGLGFTFVSILVAATTGIAGHLSGLASGLVNTSQQLGGSIGLAILTGIAASTTARYLNNTKHITKNTAALAEVHGFSIALYVAVSFAILAILVALFVIKQQKVSDKDIARAMTSAG